MISLKRIINTIVPKRSNYYYFEPMRNCCKDNYDIINYTGDSVLSFLNYFLGRDSSYKKIFLVVYHPSRIPLYLDYISKFPNVQFEFLKSDFCDEGKSLLCKIKNFINYCQCTFLFYEPILDGKPYATKKQKQISLGYFSTFKSDFLEVPFERANKKWSLISSTSKLDAIFKSAAFGVPFEEFKYFGLPRNDFLFKENSTIKKRMIKEWIYKISGFSNPQIILYAPTFRDYEANTEVTTRSIWGFNIDDKIEDYLETNNYVVIAKLHSWQNISPISKSSKRVLMFCDTFEFSFYDLMKESILLISDYSSIVLDYLLLNKPIILNLYDLELYTNVRGFAFEPYEEYCPGPIVTTSDELIKTINREITSDNYKGKREKVKKMAYLYPDSCSCERIYNYISKMV